MTDTYKGLGAIYLTVLLLATNGLFAKGLSLGSFDITFVRAFVAGAVLVALCRLMGLRVLAVSRVDAGRLLGLGVILFVHWVSFFEAMRVSSVAIGMTLLYTYPVFTVLFEAALARQRVETRDMGIALIVIIGVMLIAMPDPRTPSLALGVAWGLVSAVAFAARNVLQRRLCAHIPPVVAIAHQCLGSAALFLPLLVVPLIGLDAGSGTVSELADAVTAELWALLLLGVVFTALPHTLLATSLRYLPAKTVSFIGCLQPLIATMIALGVLGEVPPLNVLVGGMAIVSAAMIETMTSVLTQHAVRK